MRKLQSLLVVAAVLGVAAPASADIGVGLFVGQPTGLDIKVGLQRRTALDMVFGWNDFRGGRAAYGHATFLVNLGTARGSSVLVPFRLGVGGAIYDDGGEFFNDINVAVRAPFEIGLRFRRTPLEIYGEVALKITFIDSNNNNDDVDGDGGLGLRVYF